MRAVDGRTDGNWGHRSIAYTGRSRNNWWQVDLYKTYNINMVVIYNRRGAESRINGLQVNLTILSQSKIFNMQTYILKNTKFRTKKGF